MNLEIYVLVLKGFVRELPTIAAGIVDDTFFHYHKRMFDHEEDGLAIVPGLFVDFLNKLPYDFSEDKIRDLLVAGYAHMSTKGYCFLFEGEVLDENHEDNFAKAAETLYKRLEGVKNMAETSRMNHFDVDVEIEGTVYIAHLRTMTSQPTTLVEVEEAMNKAIDLKSITKVHEFVTDLREVCFVAEGLMKKKFGFDLVTITCNELRRKEDLESA